MGVWKCEYTDTFGGEANYSWVRRAEIEDNDVPPLTTRQVVCRAKRALNIVGLRGRGYWHGDQWEFRPYGCATVAFVSYEHK